MNTTNPPRPKLSEAIEDVMIDVFALLCTDERFGTSDPAMAGDQTIHFVHQGWPLAIDVRSRRGVGR